VSGASATPYDNAMAEAFVATLKSELVNHHLHGRAFVSFEDAEQHLLAWIAFYNDGRLHGRTRLPHAREHRTRAAVRAARGRPASSGGLASLG
jgi:transposase InsO family protein